MLIGPNRKFTRGILDFPTMLTFFEGYIWGLYLSNAKYRMFNSLFMSFLQSRGDSIDRLKKEALKEGDHVATQRFYDYLKEYLKLSGGSCVGMSP